MTRRIHYTNRKLTKVRSMNPISERARGIGKPDGLWYSVGTEWRKWCRSERPHWVTKRSYVLDVDTSRLLMVSGSEQLEKLETEFGVVPKRYQAAAADFAQRYPNTGRHFLQIDWAKVGEKYAGVEISPYLWTERLTRMWYYGWDVASGCIWDASAVRGFREIKRRKVEQP